MALLRSKRVWPDGRHPDVTTPSPRSLPIGLQRPDTRRAREHPQACRAGSRAAHRRKPFVDTWQVESRSGVADPAVALIPADPIPATQKARLHSNPPASADTANAGRWPSDRTSCRWCDDGFGWAPQSAGDGCTTVAEAGNSRGCGRGTCAPERGHLRHRKSTAATPPRPRRRAAPMTTPCKNGPLRRGRARLLVEIWSWSLAPRPRQAADLRCCSPDWTRTNNPAS